MKLIGKLFGTLLEYQIKRGVLLIRGGRRTIQAFIFHLFHFVLCKCTRTTLGFAGTVLLSLSVKMCGRREIHRIKKINSLLLPVMELQDDQPIVWNICIKMLITTTENKKNKAG